MGVEKTGADFELGVARCSLEGILNREADQPLAPLVLLDGKGKEVGKLTCEVTALAAMRQMTAEYDGLLGEQPPQYVI